MSETFQVKGADILITTDTLDLSKAGGIRTLSFGPGAGGNIQIQAKQATSITGASDLDALLSLSILQTLTFFTGRGGDINLSTKDLTIGAETQGGMSITAATFGVDPLSGPGGNVLVEARNIKVAGSSPIAPSSISTSSSNSQFPGSVQVRTGTLEVLAGAVVASTSLTSGVSGNIDVKADSILVSGKGNLFSSGIGTPAIVNERLNQFFRFPSRSRVDSGNTIIRTSLLRVENSGSVAIFNEGIGNAGNLEITANRIELSNGNISAETISGQGGNISIDTKILVLLNRSTISTSAFGIGGGGNIAINSDITTLLQGSQIAANALKGAGGRVGIRADGVFVSPDSKITAASAIAPQFDGVVEITTPGTELSRGGVSSIPAPDIPGLVTACSPGKGYNSFTITGGGGLPSNPDEFITSSGWRDPAGQSRGLEVTSEPEIVEAQGWEKTPNGTVRFIVNGTASQPNVSFNCVTRSGRNK